MLTSPPPTSTKNRQRAYQHEVAVVKEHLKTLIKSHPAHYRLRTSGRILKYGFVGFGRNIWLTLAAVLVMTVTLVILFVTVLASVVLSATADSMRQKIDITVFLQPGTTASELNKLADLVRADPNVRSVETRDSDAEYQAFLSDHTDNTELLETLDNEDMRQLMIDSMPATMRIKVFDTTDLSGLQDLIENNPQISQQLDEDNAPTYDSNRSEIATISSWANIAKNGGLILGIVFLVISTLVIFNTIRMAIFSRREEIYMMKLIGAENSFIRGPFIVEAEIYGFISGLLAAGLGYFGFCLLAPRLEAYGIDTSAIGAVLNSSWLVLVFALMALIGVAIGALSAYFAVLKYFREL